MTVFEQDKKSEQDKKRHEDPYWDFFHTRNGWEEGRYNEFGFFQ